MREAAQETQATRPLQLRQNRRQETHAGELTDEDGDKTGREADVRARIAPPARKGTPIPQHVQLGRYNSSDTGGFAARQGHDNPYSPAATSDNRLAEWNEASDTVTPKATQNRGTMQDDGEKTTR